ncbi:MAG TPA: type VII secretion protein EccB [Actinocrinis sp.]
MQSRKDHLQAYQFSVGRLVRAVAAGDAGAGEVPFRRSNLGVQIGVAIGVLLSGGAVIFGLISPAASTAWKANGSIVVEKETGTRYVYLNGSLHPTANYASALLVAGQNNSAVQYVPRAQLAGVPVGGALGISGAPDDVPAASSLLPGTWAACLRSNGNIVLDLDPAGRTAAGPQNQRVFVASTDPNNPAEYVVWDSVKYPLPDQDALPALGLGNQQPIAADPVWLDQLPTGAAIVPANIPDGGDTGRQVAGQSADIGTLFLTSVGGANQYYVLLSDGLAPITATEAALFAVAGYAAPAQVSPAAIAAVPASADHTLISRLPNFLSGPIYNATGPGGGSLCALQSSPGAAANTQVVTEPSATIGADPSVVVPAGDGMLVQPPAPSQSSSSGSSTPAEFLITDSGERYWIDSSDAQSALGYSSVGAHTVPVAVLRLVAAGPALDIGAAKRAET